MWQAVARSSFSDGRWVWGGRHGRNSISDAEQLMCIMGPATEISIFKLDLPDETAEDALDALSMLGDSIEIPKLLIDVIIEFLTTYTDKDGTPTFGGGTYFTGKGGAEPLPVQHDLDVVDSFSVSVRLSLATIGFARVFRRIVTRQALREKVDLLEELAGKRLTAAMVGLLRSFSVNVFDVHSPEGQFLCRMLNHDRSPTGQMIDELREQLRQINAGLRDITLGSGQVSDLDNDNKLFECGWSWGIVKGAPKVETSADAGTQRDGTAQHAPYLYFTVVALDGIEDLFSERTRMLNLLTEEQQRLSRSLQLRWDLTQSYWSKIGRFGRGRWPLEDMPWRTTDGAEGDYLTLLVSSIMVKELSNRQASGQDFARVASILEELAGRVRITRRALTGDQAVSLHHPGFAVDLLGSEDLGGPQLTWLLNDFSPQLLRQTLRVAGQLRDTTLRTDAVALADRVWEGHLIKRRLSGGKTGQLWDQPSEVYPELEPGKPLPSWYYTERVVSCLVSAAQFLGKPPQPSSGLTEVATDLLAEVDHLFDQEMLSVAAEAGPTMRTTLQGLRSALNRAHEVLDERPGTASALASYVLIELDRLKAARDKAVGAG
ncbi:hypothetical protein Pme01_47130 [Planosporangium mesophilum]|uniref:Uncharacterized protein n=1 Tax=Planosporangium mesophilum TaxID=689768 RepID=A0A8J3X2N7_9ACTN|nr:hypothetical protein Pme01_47130 [Planosporangium mesophilum]